jgi:hypothetical protein
MEQSLDLDIKNYSTEDLINFFKLDNNYTTTELDENYKAITVNVLKSSRNLQYKYDLIDFINNGKTILLKNIVDENETVIKKKLPKTNIQKQDDHEDLDIDETVGKILNPLSSHPTLQRQKINPKSSNSYNIHTTTTNYIFNTLYRDNYFNTISNNCSFTLPFTIKNVTAISLSGIQIPNVSNTFSNDKETNQLFIHEDGTGIEGIVILPDGNYTSTQFPPILESAINIQLLGSTPNRFTVTFDIYRQKITIANSTNTFTMNILTKKYNSVSREKFCLYNTVLNTNATDTDKKTGINPSDFAYTMGYIIGYRQVLYSGLKSYTGESVYQDTLQDYYYFELNDYTDYQFNTTVGVFPTGFLSSNIIAVLPITTPKYTASFDNNANFIYKTRNYAAPINLKKISIKMISPQGELVNLKQVDFSFCLQISTLYDNIMPFNVQDISLT